MKQNNFNYPIIAFSASDVHLARNEDEILICSKTALNNGFYKNMKVIDSSGVLYSIKNATKVKGHGLFWGYNIFLNQKIQVELIINESQIETDIETLKKLILKGMKKSFWDSGGNYKEIINKIHLSNSIHEIINYLSKIYYNDN